MATAPTIPDSNGVTFLANLNAALLAMGSTTITTAGAAPAFTAAVSAITALASGQQVRLKFNAAGTTGSNTLNVSGLGALNLMQFNASGTLVPATITSGLITDVLYDGTQWLVLDPAAAPSGPRGARSNLAISTTGLSAVATVTADYLTLLASGGLSALWNQPGTALTATLTSSGANGLDNSVQRACSITVASPAVATETGHGRPANAPVVFAGTVPTGLSAGTTYYVLSPTTNTYQLSATPGGAAINTTAGSSSCTVVSALAFSAWYSLWVIYNPTTAAWATLFSSSANNPSLPTGYTYMARIGWQRTQASTNYYLMHGLQLGEQFKYVVGTSGNVTSFPVLSSGIVGTWNTPTYVAVSVAGVVPPTAREIEAGIRVLSTNAGFVLAGNANNSGQTYNGSSVPELFGSISGTACDSPTKRILLESQNLYYANSDATFGLLWAVGWTDNL